MRVQRKGISDEERQYRAELAARICEARRVRALSRAEVSRRGRIHRNVVTQYEDGSVMPSPFTLLRLVGALAVSPGWLLSGTRGKAAGMICSTKATMGPEMVDPEFRNRETAVGEAANGDGKTGRA